MIWSSLNLLFHIVRLLQTDPQHHRGSRRGGRPLSNNYLVNTDHAIIVDVEASRSVRTGETHATRTVIDGVRQRFDLRPERLIADMAYGAAEMLGWLVEERGIEPQIPVIHKSTRTDGPFSREDFVYDQQRDVYTCPAGKGLRQS